MSHAEMLPVSEAQVRFITHLARDLGLTPMQRNDLIRRVTADRAKQPMQLTRGDASRVIERLKSVDLGYPNLPKRERRSRS